MVFYRFRNQTQRLPGARGSHEAVPAFKQVSNQTQRLPGARGSHEAGAKLAAPHAQHNKRTQRLPAPDGKQGGSSARGTSRQTQQKNPALARRLSYQLSFMQGPAGRSRAT